MKNRRILLVDDHKPIHHDFHEILVRSEIGTETLSGMELNFFGDAAVIPPEFPRYELTSAYQGDQARDLVKKTVADGTPFAMVFMDVRMPPGTNGIETIGRILGIDPDLQIVICTAYSDYTWEEIYNKFGDTANLVFLRKPFDHTEVRQLASALTEKWNLNRVANIKTKELEVLVEKRTADLRQKIAELEEAREKVDTLSGLIPICAGCKKIRDDKGFWTQVEVFIRKRSPVEFSHGICPDCKEKYYSGLLKVKSASKKPSAK